MAMTRNSPSPHNNYSRTKSHRGLGFSYKNVINEKIIGKITNKENVLNEKIIGKTTKPVFNFSTTNQNNSKPI